MYLDINQVSEVTGTHNIF